MGQAPRTEPVPFLFTGASFAEKTVPCHIWARVLESRLINRFQWAVFVGPAVQIAPS